MEKPTYRRKQMEFLIAAALLILGGYFGYQYYLAKKAAPNLYDLPESAEVKVDGTVAVVEVGQVSLSEAKANVEAVKEELKKPAKKATKKSTKTDTKKTDTKKTDTKKTTTAKKKPNMKIVK